MRIRNFDRYYDPPEPPDFCEVCCGNSDTCICPECPICETYGDPICYTEHGLKRSIIQIVRHDNFHVLNQLTLKKEEEFFSQFPEEL